MYFSIDSSNLKLLLALFERLGEVNGMHFNRSERAQEKNYTIAARKACLELIGIEFTSDQVQKLTNRYLVKAPENQVKAAQKLLTNFSELPELSFSSTRDFKGLNKSLAVYELQELSTAPSLPQEITALFSPLKNAHIPEVLRALQFHYALLCLLPKNPAAIELALYWQKRILLHCNEVFRFLDYESFIVAEKESYFRFVRNARPGNKADRFNRFMLKVLNRALEDYLRKQKQSVSTTDRIALFIKNHQGEAFSRQDYLRKFKFISAITASRDLRYAVDAGLFTKTGEKRFTRYQLAS